jgi:outer membrane autotransporter protein
MHIRPQWLASLALTLFWLPDPARAGGPVTPPPTPGSLEERIFDTMNSSSSTDPDFNLCLAAMNGAADTEEQTSVLRAMAPDEVPAAGSNASTAGVFVFQSLRDRLFAMREGEQEIQWAGRNGFSLNLPAGVLGFASTEDGGDVPRFGIFVNGITFFGGADDSTEEVGYDFNGGGLTAGIDYRITDQFIAGAAFGWLDRDSDFDEARGDMESDDYSGSLYASYLGEQFYADAIVTYAAIEYDIDRAVAFSSGGVTVNSIASSDPDAYEIAASAGTGYEFRPAALGGLAFGPQLQLNYVYWDIESFSESGGNGLALSYASDDVDSLQTILGGDVSYPMSFGFGVVTPQVRAGWVHEFENDRRRITSSFVNDNNGGRFFVRTDQPDRDWAVVAGSLAAAFGGGWSAFVDYETVLGLSDFKEHTMTAGVRLEF